MCACFGVYFANAQNTQPQDSIKKGVTLGSIELKDPASIVNKYTYDPVLDRYVYTSKVGKYDINYPLILTPQQYLDLVQKESIKSYFQEKIDAYSGKKSGSGDKRKNLLPNFYVNSDFFESIFGGNTIEVIPQGSVAMDLGVIYQKNDNPALSPRNRTNFSFDFDQRISLSLIGKVGERLQVSAQYDTEATFDFQNLIKLEYTPTEDDIIRKIEVGNISMPLNSSLISGAQSLFGVKTELQFGRTTVTAVFSEQRSQNSTVQAQGGGSINEFSLLALDYEEDKHFFLSQYFRDHYDIALKDYPQINSAVQITRIEVWVTNRNQQTNNVRNIVGVQDLGEFEPGTSVADAKTRIYKSTGVLPAGFFNLDPSGLHDLPRNEANQFDPKLIEAGGGAINSDIRDIATIDNGFNVPGYTVNEGFDYAILENARQLQPNRDFTYHPQLGYISLNQRLSNDEILGVAFQYTYKGEVFTVGEFSNGGIEANGVNNVGSNVQIDNNVLVVKLLKSSLTRVEDPIWDLMMKNIYFTGAFQINQEDFKMNILYTSPTPRNYISPVDEGTWPEGLEQQILLDVFNFDRLNVFNDFQNGGDGFFDYIPGITIEPQNGRIIFTKVEPFGAYLHQKLGGGNYDDEDSYNPNQSKYVFRSMYDGSKAAALEDANKNLFQIKGKYKSERGNGIPIGAFNVPRGSVRVTAGGRLLQEGADYTVNYIAGTVQIIDPSLAASNIPIEISVENNAVFGQQTRRFMGFNVEHKFSDKFLLGGTFLNLRERPLTQKANYGTEPVNNTIFGLNANYSTELPFLTRMANKLPNIDTDVASNLSLRAEVAWLKPNSPKAANFDGETTVYLDDFEGAQTLIDVRSALGWSLASRPLDAAFDVVGGTDDPPTISGDPDIESLREGYKRGKVAWYTIDPIFYTSQRPGEINDSDVSSNQTRRVFIDELYPDRDIAQGQTTVVNTLDLAYYPDEPGPYNLNVNYDGLTNNEKWAGIMRPLTNTNFENSNVEFIQFWVLDPYTNGETPDNGELVFNLGNISEDILPDGRKQYENGLPGVDSNDLVTNTIWGKVPATQSLVYAFDTNPANRELQDVGLDGLNDAEEQTKYGAELGSDPMRDNYEYYLNRDGNILERYIDYNNTQGNAPVNVTNTNRGSTTLPDTEDLDRDQTMNTVDSYFEFRVPIKPGLDIGDKFVTDVREASLTTPDSRVVNARWIQFKVPIQSEATRTAINGIDDLRSISFMRMYVTGFQQNTVLRFGSLDLVRGDWRTYGSSLQTNGELPSTETTLDVTTVNIEENESREPVPYIMPPGVFREQLNNNNTIIRQNEQALSLKVTKLKPEQSQAVYKNFNVDMRQYKRIKLFVHAEEIESLGANGEGDLVAFMRIGTDFTDNYYQIEIPVEYTNIFAASYNEDDVWKNQLDVALNALTAVKAKSLSDSNSPTEVSFYEFDGGNLVQVLNEFQSAAVKKLRYGIKGNPSVGTVRGIMLGLKNRSRTDEVNAEVWFNELRLAQLDNQGGWAAVASMDANIADFADVSANGGFSSSGFGSLDQGPKERNREETKSYDVVTNVNIGQLLPKKWGIQLPFNYGVSEKLITPEFDPVYDDLKLKERINQANTQEERNQIREQAEDYTKHTSINFIGVKKNRTGDKKPRFYDVENLTFNFSYNNTKHRDFQVEDLRDQSVKTGFAYNHQFAKSTIEPFKKNDSLFTGKSWKWLKDLNFNLLPTSISVNSNYNRNFSSQKFRQVYDSSVDGSQFLGLPELQQRNFLFNWQYAINYQITNSLRANITASNASIVRNYYGEDGKINTELDLWSDFWNTGEANHFQQNLELNYELPFNKIPYLDFMSATYTYNSNFDWQRGGDVLRSLANEDINTVQNSNSHSLNATLSMKKLYRELGLVTKKSRSRRTSKALPTKDGKKAKTKKKSKLGQTALGLITMVDRINVNYTENNGKALPGYTRGLGFLGTTKPSIGFIFGSQEDVRFEAAKRGYLTTYENFYQPYVARNDKTLNITAVLSPLNGLTIDLKANRQFSSNYEENFRIDGNLADNNLVYETLIGNERGDFSISNMMISTMFQKSDEFGSETFETFRENRLEVARRLAAANGADPNVVDADGYPVGYGKKSQDVLLPAFVSAYTGQSAGKVKLGAFRNTPIPNWTLKYTGLIKNKWFRKRFKRFSISNGYRSSYSINSFQSNLEKKKLGADAKDVNGNFLSDNIYRNVTLVDQLDLVKLDFEMKNSISMLAEIKMDRSLSLSFDNGLLTEVNGKEYKLGLGYRMKDVKFRMRVAGKKETFKGDLNLKGDFSLRDNLTVIRNLDIENNQITSGQRLLSFKFGADYAFSRNLNVLFFYDHAFSKFKVSTAFPQTTVNAGFTLRYNFGN
ncbi:MAG: cell surface protein SprA [Flavobacteriaceae bacterium]|nr:cell surface protein SprA [Flavobacteriaceae bacterium]